MLFFAFKKVQAIKIRLLVRFLPPGRKISQANFPSSNPLTLFAKP